MSANLDNSRIAWPGSGSRVNSNSVPFGYYLSESCASNETTFENDCSGSAMFAAKKMGYPIVDIEMIDVNFYAAFEEAVMEYNRVINEFNIINNLAILEGSSQATFPNLTGVSIQGTGLPFVVQLSKQYGSEAMVGGNVEVHRNYIVVSGSGQNSTGNANGRLNNSASYGNHVYDLDELIARDIQHLTGSGIEIKRVFHYAPPAVSRVYDPFSMTGMSYSNILGELGFAGFSPATQFLMTPIFEDLERIQAIEFNDMVRRSAYSFEILGKNKLRLFPIPTTNFRVYIDYILTRDTEMSNIVSGSRYDYISDASDIPYGNCIYCKINQPGKQWIRKYFLALCKETLGRILQKYTTIPIPGGEITLDGAELRSEAKEEKDKLIDTLREFLDKTLRVNQLQNREEESDAMQNMMRRVPTKIYIA